MDSSTDNRSSAGGNGGGGGSTSRRYGVQFSTSNFIQAPLSALLEYSGILRPPPQAHSDTEPLVSGEHVSSSSSSGSANNNNGGEVLIRIIGAGEAQDSLRAGSAPPQPMAVGPGRDSQSLDSHGSEHIGTAAGAGMGEGGGEATEQSASVAIGEQNVERDTNVGGERDSSYQRYDIQQIARWIEQVLPFSLLLLVVFIRQHLQGFFVTIWIAAVMFKSNDILKKQTALKGERKFSVLMGITLVFMVHVFGVYWWYKNDDLLYPLVLLPPKGIPPFWHAIFIIMVNGVFMILLLSGLWWFRTGKRDEKGPDLANNMCPIDRDTMIRQAAMVVKCLLLMYYKNSRGRNYRRQGQMLTLVEYLLLLYRALLPAPVWYRFFLNKEYGSLFSSLTTGLYLTFKLTSVVEKVQAFIAAFKASSRKDVHYGSHATSEQVIAAGDLCAICQEKMHAPILLRCKHIFCEDCVSEWFERERTCPLCRALVKPADLRSYGDGSTSLFFQLF